MATSRGRNYSDEELKQLAYSSLHVSQDPIVGNSQRGGEYWKRVHAHFEENKPPGCEDRGKKSLEGKWADIKHDVAKFIGCYEQVRAQKPSGTNEADRVKSTHELYKSNHPKGKGFTFESCWYIMRECPRWKTPADDHTEKGKMKKTAKAKGKENSTPNVVGDDTTGSDNAEDKEVNDAPQGSSCKRPQGGRSAKEEQKRLKLQGESMQASAAAQKEMAAANSQRARVLENNSSLALLSLPTECMSADLRDFMNSWKLEEAIKLKARMDRQHKNSLNCNRVDRPSTEEPLPFVRQPVFPFQSSANVVHVSDDSGDEAEPSEDKAEAGDSIHTTTDDSGNKDMNEAELGWAH